MMSNYTISDRYKHRPDVPLTPLIDIVFLILIFFMTISTFTQLESELNINVPKAMESKKASRTPGEIIINVTEKGAIIVNQQKLNYQELTMMLKKISNLFPDQPVIVRADENSYHKYVINVLDACASADIWNISFSTQKDTDR